MKCPKCGFLSSNDLERCKRCGADWAGERAQIETQIDARIRERAKREAEALAAEFAAVEEKETKSETGSLADEAAESPAEETGAGSKPTGQAFSLDEEFDRLYESLRARELGGGPPRWGGFFRRITAFSIDLIVLSVLSRLLFYLMSTGFQVGLSAHGPTVTVDHFLSLIHIFILAWVGLVAGYFVMLPAMSGMTVGKWVMGLRIVAADLAPISYPQAMLRWLGYALSAPLALGFVWIVVNKEKRAWHDFLSRTWVVRA